MASTKLALLLCGFMVIASMQSTKVEGQKICPQFCYDDPQYMTCPSTGYKPQKPACNCCIAGEKGCTIYLGNGEVVNCT